jgi:hypothetical protein
MATYVDRRQEMPGSEVGRPIEMGGMAYAPSNEAGVVFLFGRLAPRMGFHVETIGSSFPDCVARYRGKPHRIEIEYRASDYEAHGHPPRGADMIVCWENDWEHRQRKYRNLQIVELKRYVGAMWRAFYVGCDEEVRGDVPDTYKRISWSVPVNAQVDDLIVMYRKMKPSGEIRDLWVVVGSFLWTKGGDCRQDCGVLRGFQSLSRTVNSRMTRIPVI